MKILIENGANLEIKDVDGETPTFLVSSSSAPEILKENIVDNFLGSSIIQLSQKEPLFLPDNSKSLRNRVITISSNEKVSKYALKTFTYFSNIFLKCLNLDSFNLKFSSFITYVTSNIKSIFSAFLNRFSNFNFDINKIRLYKSDSVKLFLSSFFYI